MGRRGLVLVRHVEDAHATVLDRDGPYGGRHIDGKDDAVQRAAAYAKDSRIVTVHNAQDADLPVNLFWDQYVMANIPAYTLSGVLDKYLRAQTSASASRTPQRVHRPARRPSL